MKFHQLTRNLFLVVIIMVGLTSVSGATDLNIADLRQNDQTGTAVYLDQVVTTTGIVTVANEFGATGPVYIQNEGAGIALYGAGYVARLRPGYVVNVTSKVGFYSGLTELLWIDTVTVVNILDKTEIPEPTIVSISEILNQQWDGYEALEGSLIKLENVSFQMIGNFAGNTNYTITDNIGYSMDIRIDNDVDLVGSPIPTVPVTIVGVLSQFDSSSPFSEGYQLLPRSSSDITGGQGGGSTVLNYSFDKTTSDPLVSSWNSGSGNLHLADNFSTMKEGLAALEVGWQIVHEYEWGGNGTINYAKNAPVGEYLDVSGADYLTLWVYNAVPASQSERTLFEFHLLEAGGDAVYDGTCNSAEHWLYRISGVFDQGPGWNQIRMPLIDRGAEFPNDQGFSAPGWNGVANNGILDKDRIVGWQIIIQTNNTSMGDIVTGTTLFDQLQLETGGGSNLTSQDVTVTFSVDMSSFNGEFADVSLQGGTLPLNWYPGSTPMNDSDGDGIYTLDILFPAGTGKIVEYKYTALNTSLTDTAWFWENFAGNRSFEIDDSSPIQRLRLDSWISGGVTTAALSYSFDKTTSDSLVSSWNSGSGNLHLADNFSTMKEGLAALEVGWQIVHEYEWGGNGTINYAKNAPVGEYLDVSGADYLTLWVYNMTSASQSGKTFFEFNLLEAGGEAAYDGTANSTEQWSYWKSGVFDLEPGWNQIRMPLIDRGTENPNDQGFSAPGWNGVANNGILDKDRIVGWQIIIQTNNTSMGDIVTGTTLFDQLQLETGGGSNLTSQDVTVTFSVDMSSFNGDFAAVSLQGGTAPLDWFPGSTRMIDPEQDGIYTVDVLFPAGSDKMVEYKFTALTDTGWVWENFVGNRSFEIDDSSPIQRLRLDSWISGGVTTAALSYSFDKTTSDSLVSSWNSGSGNLHLADNFSTMKEGLAALEVGWQIVHEYEWGGNGTINYAKNAPVGEYLDVSGADYLTLWVYNAVPASQSERTLFEFHLLEAGGDAVYDGTCNSAEHWLYRISGVFDQGPGWNQIRMPLIDRGAEHPNDQGFSAPGWNGVANNGILDKDRIVGWQIIIQTNNTSMGDIVTGTTLFDQLKLETGGGGEIPVLSHFAPVYTGNPYLAMNIYVTDAKIDGVTLGVGDEIGIFDGDICVGAEVVTGTIAPYLPLVAATDDPTTTEKDGFTPGHTISYRLWDRDQSLEINSVQPTYTQGEGLFSSQGTAVVSLVGSYSISQTIGLDLGWNIVSFCAIPENPDMLNVFQNLVNNNSLIKIQNETGNAVEKLGAIGWVNNIGNLTATEGYYVKVASNQTMTIEGNGIPLPLGIPLTSGWNIMSYPASSAQNALDVIQPLIDDGKLQKVQDEVGNAIENLPTIGWVNNIGNFEPGKGYYIKVNSASAVTVNQPARSPLAKSQVATLAVPPSHYLPITETNPYLPMNVYVMSANVEGEPLKTGAEIAIYYQDQCITAAALPYPLNTENAYLPLIIGADDPLSEEIEGFNENDPISFKIWDGNEELLVSAKAVKYEDNAGLLKFNAHGTIVVELEAQRIPKEYSLHQNYPNPFNPTTTLRYELPKPGKVEIRIFDLQGRLVNQLVSEYQEVGKYSVVWNGCDNNGVPVPSGIYFYQLNTGSYSKTRKAILMK